jgi:hypothetical protein
MRCAVLGTGSDALRIVARLRRRGEHEIVAHFEAPDLAPTEDQDSWESLLSGTLADALIVGNTLEPDRRADQLRKLVQASVPMILVHPACEAIIGYELDMIGRDTGCIMIPYSPGILHPLVASLAQVARGESPIGRVEQLVFARQMDKRDRREVLRQFARDALLIRQILGDITQLSALGPKPADAVYSNLSVHMSAADQTLVRWSVAPCDDQPRAELQLVGAHGRGTAEMRDGESRWSWNVPGVDTPGPDGSRWDEARAVLDQLVAAMGSVPARPSWDEACRAVELTESIDISLERQRTIQLHHEEHTEEDTFKGMMAVGGCCALLVTLLVTVLVAVVDALDIPMLDHPFWQAIPWGRNWPLFLFAFLALFLLLQLFRFLFPTSPSGTDQSADSKSRP